MIVSILMAITLLFAQTPDSAEGDDTNVFIDLGTEHCATEIAFAAYERTAEDEFATTARPPYMTYTAFQFESADQAEAALDDLPTLVAQTFSDDPDFMENEEYDQLVTEVDTEDYGDQSIAYIMSLPVDNEELGALTVEMLGVMENDQVLLILMFSETGTTTAAPGMTFETVPPFMQDMDEPWDGSGDLQDAIPSEEEMPIGWEGRDVVLEDPPGC